MRRFLKEPFPYEVALIKVAEQYNLKANVVSHPDCGASVCILILSSYYMQVAKELLLRSKGRIQVVNVNLN